MNQPAEAPDPFCNSGGSSLYDAPRGEEAAAAAAGRMSSNPPRPQATSSRPPPIPYAAPGSSSGSVNPASTVAFMLNMGYPPPPIALEPLRRLIEQTTQGPGQQLSLQSALYVTDEISRSPYRISPAVLFVLQQRLHSSKPDRVSLALDLLDMCVKNCGLDFVRHINKEFMKSMSSIVKTTSFKERTFTGQVKKLERYLTGSPSSGGIATDPRVHKLRRQVLSMIQNWTDAFTMHPNQIAPILESYRALKRKGYQFPPKDVSQKYLVKNAEDSPAFQNVSNIATPPPVEGTVAAVWAGENDFAESAASVAEDQLPFTNKQFAQIERLILLLRTTDDEEIAAKALAMCDRLRPKLEDAMRDLTARVNNSSSRKLRANDARVTQLNVVFDLDAEVKKRRGTRLLFGVPPAVGPQISGSETGASPISSGRDTTNTPPVFQTAAAPAPAAKPKATVNLLDDLFDDDEGGDKKEQPAPSLPAASNDDLESIKRKSEGPGHIWGNNHSPPSPGNESTNEKVQDLKMVDDMSAFFVTGGAGDTKHDMKEAAAADEDDDPWAGLSDDPWKSTKA